MGFAKGRRDMWRREAYRNVRGILLTNGLIGHFRSDTGLYTNTTMSTPATAASAAIAAWKDLSGAGNHLIQATSNLRPSLSLNVRNGFPAVVFASDYMRIATPVTMNAFTGFVVAQDTADSSVWVSEGTSTNSYIYTSNLVRFKAGSGTQRDTSTITENQWHIAGGRTDGTTANAYHNGTASANQANTEDMVWGAVGQYNGSALIGGQIAEIVLYNRALSATERAQVEKYLNEKYLIF